MYALHTLQLIGVENTYEMFTHSYAYINYIVHTFLYQENQDPSGGVLTLETMV